MGPIMVKIVIAVIALAIGALIGYIYRKNVGEKAIGSAEQKARNLILDAENRSESMKKEAILEAKEEAHRLRSEAERDARERRAEIQRSERRLIQKEDERKAIFELCFGEQLDHLFSQIQQGNLCSLPYKTLDEELFECQHHVS